jgi:hypothetical protein
MAKYSAHAKQGKRWEQPKWRANWKGACLRFNCVNRDTDKCRECIRFSEYKEKK